mmetsp:Transcript_17968/g.31824  ORF Transcript_17968/g.31824 Transcript_17968/m.31824 type:complete len:203 (-) Transcript_17968:268-876(-)
MVGLVTGHPQPITAGTPPAQASPSSGTCAKETATWRGVRSRGPMPLVHRPCQIRALPGAKAAWSMPPKISRKSSTPTRCLRLGNSVLQSEGEGQRKTSRIACSSRASRRRSIRAQPPYLCCCLRRSRCPRLHCSRSWLPHLQLRSPQAVHRASCLSKQPLQPWQQLPVAAAAAFSIQPLRTAGRPCHRRSSCSSTLRWLMRR